MLTELCQECNNYFVTKKTIGKFKIQGGTLVPSVDLITGQYFRIVGSRLNDGVHKFSDPNDVLQDEPEFEGAVWDMRVPKAFVELSQEISTYDSTHEVSPFTSESFGGYSYSKGINANGVPITTWREAFASALNKWRKI